MITCLICNRTFKSNMGLSIHLKKTHKISKYLYDKRFNLLCFCKVCGKEICCLNKSKCCTHCRDRTGTNNPFYNKNHSENTIKILKEKNRKNTKKLWLDENYRNKVIKRMSKPRSEKFKKEQSERITKWYTRNPDQRLIRSKNMKDSWKNGKIVSNNFSCNKSNLEKKLYKILLEIDKDLISEHTLYTTDNKYFFPDIINLEKKIIIEFFGDYWHCNPKKYNKHDEIHIGLSAEKVWDNDKQRILSLEKMGYTVYIIWEEDFKNNKTKVLNSMRKVLLNE